MLRLGVHGLTQAETGLVRAYLALAAGGRAGAPGWTLVADGPCDALLLDASELRPQQVLQARGAQAAALLGRAQAGSGWTVLARPLNAEAFDRWLASCGPSRPPAQAAPGPAVLPASGASRVRLRRWPPAELLRSEAARMRMATVLSRRHLNARELSKLTEQNEAACQRFIHLLQGFQLLETETVDVAPAPATLAGTAPAARWNLVRSIRRRLGL